jgi:hypothetical protein
MILLSHHGWPASQIADVLGYDPSTVRRWIHRYQGQGTPGLADRPRSGRPRLGSRRLGQRILRLLDQPKAWTIGRLWHAAGRPAISLRTLHRRVREVACWRRPRLVARGDPDRGQVRAFFRQRTTAQMLTTAAPNSSPWLPDGYVQTSGRLLRRDPSRRPWDWFRSWPVSASSRGAPPDR